MNTKTHYSRNIRFISTIDTGSTVILRKSGVKAWTAAICIWETEKSRYY